MNERNLYNEAELRKAAFEEAIKLNGNELKVQVKAVLREQKEDGSFSLIDNYRIDADCRVAYGYVPSYYGTAILMKADCESILSVEEEEAFEKALKFSMGRNLVGAGYEATEGLLEALYIFIEAGLFKWMQVRKENYPEFCQMIENHITEIEDALREGRTFSDWSRDFKTEFGELIDLYYASIADENDFVWYAAYGSNINSERFKRYIDRCTDKNMPEESMPYTFNHPVYFGGVSTLWNNGGTSFLDDKSSGFAYGRAYKVSLRQLNEIQRMEGSKYTKRVCLERLDGVPVYTFTSKEYMGKTLPSGEYVETILNGLKEVYTETEELLLETYIYMLALNDEHLKTIEVLRSAAHGVRIADIMSVTELKLAEQRKVIKYLSTELHMIQQDRRSVVAGHKWNAIDAVYFSSKEKRRAMDNLVLFNRMR